MEKRAWDTVRERVQEEGLPSCHGTSTLWLPRKSKKGGVLGRVETLGGRGNDNEDKHRSHTDSQTHIHELLKQSVLVERKLPQHVILCLQPLDLIHQWTNLFSQFSNRFCKIHLLLVELSKHVQVHTLNVLVKGHPEG